MVRHDSKILDSFVTHGIKWPPRPGYGFPGLPFVKMIGRFVPKDWPPVDRRAKCAPQAGLPLFWSDRAKSPVFVVPFCSPGFTSQSTCNECERPTFWHKAANHFDKWQKESEFGRFGYQDRPSSMREMSHRLAGSSQRHKDCRKVL